MFKSIQKTAKNRLLGAAIITAFLSVLFLSLFNMPMGMDMAGNTSDCPFMIHEAALCSNVLDHIGAWQSSFLTTTPSFSLLLLVLLGAVGFLSAIPPNLLI